MELPKRLPLTWLTVYLLVLCMNARLSSLNEFLLPLLVALTFGLVWKAIDFQKVRSQDSQEVHKTIGLLSLFGLMVVLVYAPVPFFTE